MKPGPLALALLLGLASGARLPAAPLPEAALDPARVADYQKRFQQGYALEKAGQAVQAREIYDGILAEQPDARRSLLEAGRISLKLGDLPRAEHYFSHLHALEPEYPAAIEALVQINQGLGRDVKVELLRRQFRTLHESGKNAEFSASPNFVRDRFKPDATSEVTITEFFDYTHEPYIAWLCERRDGTGAIVRQLMLRYDPVATQAIRAKDPRLAATEEFLLVDDVIENRHIVRIDVYNQLLALPDYKKLRNTMLAIMAGTLKPIYTQAVGETAPTTTQAAPAAPTPSGTVTPPAAH